MIRPPLGRASSISRTPGLGRGTGVRRPYRRHRRGASEVLATIILLAMTVTLFSAVFLSLNRLPKAPPQPVNQFTASLSYGQANGKLPTKIMSLSLVHLSGPVVTGSVAGQTAIYVSSQNRSAAFPTPFTLPQGLGGSSAWSFGQTWTVNISTNLVFSPDNLTVAIVSADQLLFRAVLTASTSTAAPYFTQATVTSSPAANPLPASSTYNVSVGVVCAGGPCSSVKVNISELQGSTTPPISLAFASKLGIWWWLSSASSDKTPNPATTTTYYVFVTATDSSGRTDTTVVSVPVA